MAPSEGVSRRSSRSKAVGAVVPSGFGDGVEGQEVESLHGPVSHTRNTKGSQFSRVFGNIHAPQRFWLVASLPQGVYGGYFLARRRPGYPVDAGSCLATICRHPFDGNGLAAERVSQQALQGFDLVPPAVLCCLHDTRLEAAHSTFGLAPVDMVPVVSSVGGCTRATSGALFGCTGHGKLRHL